MSEYKCKNDDVIRVGGVYEYSYDPPNKYLHAVTRISGDKMFGFENRFADDEFLYDNQISRELPRDEDGYYIWEGGEQPVPDDWVVEIKGRAPKYRLTETSAYNVIWDSITAFRVVNTGAVHEPEPSTNNERAQKEKFSWNETVPEIPYTGNGLEFEPDMVSSPPHYRQGGIECIDAIRAALTPEEFRGYCKGNAIKYVWREKHKGGDESMKKAVWYIEKELD